MDNLGFMFAAFAIIWGAFFVYVIVLSRRQKQLRRDLGQLEAMLHKEPK